MRKSYEVHASIIIWGCKVFLIQTHPDWRGYFYNSSTPQVLQGAQETESNKKISKQTLVLSKLDGVIQTCSKDFFI